ncbi:hypothetical protein QBC46DRAFT_346182 [Diplogelasinospora grovesii]|uniref:Uncharacterized protein n=1 Tax=Diplogelasinospora grovesii TaxID=303347 RepID=A0AAN6N0C7_9PEZI|nr:hypothetical protein QBC46DRAFT_346182 [Diplogelasinospora grovesii]
MNFLLFFYRLSHQIREYLIFWWVSVILVIGCGAASIGIVPYSCHFWRCHIYHPEYQDYESKVVLSDLIQAPEEFLAHAERSATSVISSAVYGVRLAQLDHPIMVEFYALWTQMLESGLVARPKPYTVRINPRTASARQVVQDSLEKPKTDILDFDSVDTLED